MADLIGFLEQYSRLSPTATALLSPGRPPISYERLWRQVCEAVGSLRSAGVQSSDRVAVVLPNGPEMAVTFLGVASACACAPLNPAYRTPEFEFYFDDLRPKAVI